MLNFKKTGSVFAMKFFKIAQNRGHVSERVSQANASLAGSITTSRSILTPAQPSPLQPIAIEHKQTQPSQVGPNPAEASRVQPNPAQPGQFQLSQADPSLTGPNPAEFILGSVPALPCASQLIADKPSPAQQIIAKPSRYLFIECKS